MCAYCLSVCMGNIRLDNASEFLRILFPSICASVSAYVCACACVCRHVFLIDVQACPLVFFSLFLVGFLIFFLKNCLIQVEDAGQAFSKQLDDGHNINCPWRGNSCPESLVQFPPTPQSALIGGYKDRCDGLLQFQSLPVIATCAIEHMQVSRGPQIDRLLSQSQNLIVGEVDMKPELIPELENSRDGAFYLYSRVR